VADAQISRGVQKRVELRVGEQHSIPATTVEKYSEGTPGVIDVRLPDDAKEFIVVGIKPGTSTLLLIHQGGRKETVLFEVKGLSSEVPKRENIRLDFYFVELRRGGRYQVGVNWPNQLGADVALEMNIGTDGFGGATASISNIPLPRLDILQQGNWAKIARQASIVTANGEEALFRSGGNINVQVQGALTADVKPIPYGTDVKILPRYDSESGRLELRVDAQVSSVGGEAIPSQQSTSVKTVVNVELNQAIVLGGIFSKDKGRSKAGLPLLSQIPVLGALFGSHGGRNEEMQAVVFIVPSVVDIVGQGAREEIRQALVEYGDFEGELDGVELLKAAGSKGR
jgi:pilus assembly protein CpaC